MNVIRIDNRRIAACSYDESPAGAAHILELFHAE